MRFFHLCSHGKINTISGEPWANLNPGAGLEGAPSPPISAMEEEAPKGGTGAGWEEKQEANGVNLGKEGCGPLGAEVREARLFGGGQLQPQQRLWVGQEGCAGDRELLCRVSLGE